MACQGLTKWLRYFPGSLSLTGPELRLLPPIPSLVNLLKALLICLVFVPHPSPGRETSAKCLPYLCGLPFCPWSWLCDSLLPDYLSDAFKQVCVCLISRSAFILLLNKKWIWKNLELLIAFPKKMYSSIACIQKSAQVLSAKYTWETNIQIKK